VREVESERIRELFYDQVRRGTATDGLSEVSVTPRFVRWSATSNGGWSEVSWTDLDGSNADRVILEQIEHFSSIGTAFHWRIYGGDLPEDLSDRLEWAGFEYEGTSELMIAHVDDVAIEVVLPDGVSLVRANDELALSRLIAVHEQVFEPDQSGLRRSLLAQFAVAPWLNELVVAMVEGEPVSSARVQFFPDMDFAGLWGGSTVQGWRGNGLYRAMVALRARIAAERGYSYLYVVASDQSRPILEHLTFGSFGKISSFIWHPDDGRQRT
jgi:hypothetical protein